jgi:hypothetical protein
MGTEATYMNKHTQFYYLQKDVSHIDHVISTLIESLPNLFHRAPIKALLNT